MNAVNTEDMGYGPAMLITGNEVKLLSESLNSINEEAFRKKFIVSDMKKFDIYPGTDEINDNFFDYVWGYLTKIKKFFKQAMSEQQCILFYIQ